jgi:hypothetical protein
MHGTIGGQDILLGTEIHHGTNAIIVTQTRPIRESCVIYNESGRIHQIYTERDT